MTVILPATSLKFRLKTFNSFKNDETQNVYIDAEHLVYWKRFCVPIIVCCVDLETERIYWRHITATEAFDSDGVAKKVTFDLEKDLLTPAARDHLKELACPEESKHLE